MTNIKRILLWNTDIIWGATLRFTFFMSFRSLFRTILNLLSFLMSISIKKSNFALYKQRTHIHDRKKNKSCTF